MTVVCVKKPIITRDGSPRPSPEVGDIDLVTGEKLWNGKLFYFLERFGNKQSYISNYFAILPDTPAEVIAEEETVEA